MRRMERSVFEERKMYQGLQVGLRRQWWEYGRKERIWAATSFGRPGIRVRASSISRRNADDDDDDDDDDGGNDISSLFLSYSYPVLPPNSL